MKSILENYQSRANDIRNTRPAETAETAGTLAMNEFHSLFETDVYDTFTTANPFAIDYSMYSDCGDCIADGGFLSSFSNAVSTLSDGGFSCGASFSGGDCGGCSSGGFSSVC